MKVQNIVCSDIEKCFIDLCNNDDKIRFVFHSPNNHIICYSSDIMNDNCNPLIIDMYSALQRNDKIRAITILNKLDADQMIN